MNLQVRIKKKLGKINLDVEFETKDDIFAILGASGCGKSMTLKCIAGIETPDEGRIVLNDRVLYDSEKKINLPPQKRKVGYLFQDYALFPNMTVQQNIMAGMGKKPDMSLVSKYIDCFQLSDVEKHYPAQLSGGQKQRTATARMLAAKPEAILLDEPFSALDSYLRWEMEQQMREILSEEKKPAVFVSHNRDEVYRMCNRVCCINQGKTESVQPVKEFFQAPETKTAAILSGCKNISDVQLIDSHHARALDWNIILFCPDREIPKDTEAVGIRAHSFYIPEETEKTKNCFPVSEYRILEDVFEWNISFKPNKESGWIQWKTAKSEWDASVEQMPKLLAVNEQNLLFFGINKD